jgi:hypothetical protein
MYPQAHVDVEDEYMDVPQAHIDVGGEIIDVAPANIHDARSVIREAREDRQDRPAE